MTNQSADKSASSDRLRPGDELRKPSATAKKLGRSLSWVWEKLRKDPMFPRPLRNGDGMCFFIERELDDYMKRTLGDRPIDRARHARERLRQWKDFKKYKQ